MRRPLVEFQFTPLREGRPEAGRSLHAGGDFNSRPYVRGDPGGTIRQKRSYNISIHAPT